MQAGSKKALSVFDYLDYRAYLADYYVEKKEQGRGFSFRAFSRRAGLQSPNHLKLVIEGERGLSDEMAPRYAKALGLEGEEASYFVDLVSFNQAKTASERIDSYQRLTGHRGYRAAQRLDQQHAAYYSRWYIPAIREMAMQSDFVGEPVWIAERMVPQITPEQAEEALKVLLDLKLLHRLDDGTLAISDWVLATPDETRGVHLATYHRALLQRASESIDILSSAERNLSAVTLCVSAGGYQRIVDRVQRFRQELVSLASLEDEGSQVIHVGIQVFPLTRRVDA
jgi:uncharacterized protein (TIGR02147 family)